LEIGKSTVGIDKSTVGIDRSTVGIDKSTVGIDRSTVGIDKSTVGIDKSTVGIDKSWIKPLICDYSMVIWARLLRFTRNDTSTSAVQAELQTHPSGGVFYYATAFDFEISACCNFFILVSFLLSSFIT